MNDFLTRGFSGLLYAFLIIFSLVISDFFFSTIILIFTLLALVEFQRITFLENYCNAIIIWNSKNIFKMLCKEANFKHFTIKLSNEILL